MDVPVTTIDPPLTSILLEKFYSDTHQDSNLSRYIYSVWRNEVRDLMRRGSVRALTEKNSKSLIEITVENSGRRER